MENELRTMIEKGTIADIDREFCRFMQSANDCPDKLKLTFVLLNILREGVKALRSVDMDGFIAEVRTNVDELDKQATNLTDAYGVHLKLNDKIADVLTNRSNSQIKDLQQRIAGLLSEYDTILKGLVEVRDSLPVEKQLEQEKQ